MDDRLRKAHEQFVNKDFLDRIEAEGWHIHFISSSTVDASNFDITTIMQTAEISRVDVVGRAFNYVIKLPSKEEYIVIGSDNEKIKALLKASLSIPETQLNSPVDGTLLTNQEDPSLNGVYEEKTDD